KRPPGYWAPPDGVYVCFWMPWRILTASKVSRPVPCSTLSELLSYILSKVLDDCASRIWNSFRLLTATAGFTPRKVRGRAVPRLMARTGDVVFCGGRARFNQPSRVAFRPGVPDSM